MDWQNDFLLFIAMDTILPWPQFNYFGVFHSGTVNYKPDDGPYFMPALFTGSTGVHVQAIELIIIHDLQNMGMAAYKKLWPLH